MISDSKRRLKASMQTLANWFNAADSTEQYRLAVVVEEYLDNLATCFRCSDPLNKKHVQEIDAIESEVFNNEDESDFR